MEEPRLYNSRIIGTFLDYFKNARPDIDIPDLYLNSGITPYEVEDEGHWLTQRQVDDFHDAVMMQTDDPAIFREAGRYMVTARSMSAIRQFIMGFLTPVQAYSMLGKIASYLNRGCTFQANKISGNKVEIVIEPLEGVVDKPYQCENRKGSFEAVAKFFTNKFPLLEHPVCIHEGGSHCRYILSWEEPPFLKWRRIRNYFAIPSILAMVVCGFLLSVGPLVVLGSVLTLAIIGLSYYAQYAEKRDVYAKIEQQGDTANRLLDQITIGYNNALLVQEIGQAVTSILDIDRLLNCVIETLEKRLGFDRGMIMLANADKTRLVYVNGYGYDAPLEKVLQETEFHLDNPKSKGPFVVAFKQQKPILVSNSDELKNDVSSRSAVLMEKLGVSSFICVPIVYEGKSEGILAVDNYQSHRPHNQSEVSLLMGIAPQIAISINTARIYEKLKEREKRFRILAESAPDIIFTLNTRGMLTYVNPMWEKILNHKQAEVVGRYLTEFVQEKDSGYLSQIFRKVRDHKETQMDILLTLTGSAGTEHNFSFNCAPNIAEDGHVDGLVGIFKDVTDLRRSEVALKKSYEKLQLALSGTISVISLIVESRDPYTAGHQGRVAELASAIARELGLSEERVQMIHMAGLIHDIGKINVPAEILSRPGKLNALEFSLIKAHPETGYGILSKVDFPAPIAQIVYQHHEKMDGSGYPLMISGDQIILEARIITVADVVEAMAGHRPYRPALGIEKALEEIQLGRGIVYDAAVADACISLFKTNRFHFEVIAAG
ncbi:MAG: HD domain-containing protein [Deltaproteobacteria bacterium]|nr:HD domain-containing protein [Deltaproteobacteria bacterium]